MRVTFNMLHDSVDAINRASADLVTAERQLTSGKVLNVPSDNPAAAQDAILQHDSLGSIDSYVKAGDAVQAHQSTADSVLSDIIDKITLALTQATASRGTTATQTVRDAAAVAVTGARDSILGDVNTKIGSSSIFAGSAVNQTAYAQVAGAWVYQGDVNPVQLKIDNTRTASLTWNGQAILQGGAAQNVLDTLDQLSADISANNDAGIASGITALQAAFSRATVAQSQLGTDENSVQDAQTRLSTLRLATDTRRSQDEDANMADSATKLAQAQTAYQAAIAATAKIGQISLLNYLQ